MRRGRSKRATWGALLAALLLVSAPLSSAAPRGPRHHLVKTGKAIEPGQRVLLEVAPPVHGMASAGGRAATSRRAAPQFRYAWQVVSGPGSITTQGVYKAPYLIGPDETAVRVELLVKNDAGQLDTLLRDELRLAPGVFPGADSCLGPGQSFDGDAFEDTELDELPEVATSVAAEYPAAARASRAQANFVVRAIVCRSGRVLDGYAVWPVDSSPEPRLERAAIDAALQWTFTPATSGGHAVAAVVDIPFVFKP